MARKADYPIDSLFLKRWSPRAMSGESLSDEQIMTLFEAARWAPSSYNNQPWRFIYAKRQTPAWQPLFNVLVPANQEWAQHAAVIFLLISHTVFALNNKPSRTHSFDAGAAWENLALQATILGLVAHGMEGFDYAKAKSDLRIPDTYTVEAMFAIGKPGNSKDLPEPLQAREFPSDRKPVKELVFEGIFTEK